MIGIIHRVLFELLEREGGAELAQRVGTAAGLSPDAVRISDTYPDEQLKRLLEAALAHTGMSRQAMVDAYAQAFLDYALALFPAFFAMASDSRDFLRRQPKIHTTLGAGLAALEDRQNVHQKFQLEEADDGSLLVSYRSVTGLCDLYHALAHKVAAHYGDHLLIRAEHCGSGGGCTLRLIFNPPVTLPPQPQCTHPNTV